MRHHEISVGICGTLIYWLLLTAALAAVKMPVMFSDHMVLQREMPVPFWGWADPGEKVTVKLADQAVQATAGADSQWQVKLAPIKASSQPMILTVAAATNTITIKDVVVGDVWLCSGQSNMRMVLSDCNSPDDILTADFPMIREFYLWQRASAEPRSELQGNWRVCSSQAAGAFTAAGFYFARKIHREIGVPIGLLTAPWGGTRIEPWLTPEGLESVPELKLLNETLAKQFDIYRKEVAEKLPEIEARISAIRKALADNLPLPSPPEWPMHPICASANDPNGLHCLYYGMIHPLVPFAIKGVLWYQGESNSNGECEQYFHKMRALIGGWRTAWGQGEFPFYFVQLASILPPTTDPAEDGRYALLRWAQTKALSIPRTGMAVAIDIGDVIDNHPKNKKDVGERLALWALRNDYGRKTLECSGPIFREMKVEGDKARIFFDHTGTGLMVGKKEGREPTGEVKGGKLQRFAVAGADGKWVWAEAVIDGSTVVVSSTNVAAPVTVRYAYAFNPEGCNLYNREGLPASPFTTESLIPAKPKAENKKP